MRKQRIEFRISSLEKEILKKKAEHAGLSISDYCRRSALGQKVSYKLTAEELEAYKMLIQYRNNFVSISNLFKNNQSIGSPVLELVRQLDEHLKKFK